MLNGNDPTPPTLLHRVIVGTLQADPVLDMAVDIWRTYDGRDKVPQATPAVGKCELALFPSVISVSAESPDSFVFNMATEVQIALPATDAADYLDVWAWCMRAILPPDFALRLAIQAACRNLITAGDGLTAEFGFSPPRPKPQTPAAGSLMTLTGQILYGCRWVLNP